MGAESVPTDRYVLYMPDFDPIFSTVRRDDSPPFRLWSDPLTRSGCGEHTTTFLHGTFVSCILFSGQ
jgi:hypothetical protein